MPFVTLQGAYSQQCFSPGSLKRGATKGSKILFFPLCEGTSLTDTLLDNAGKVSSANTIETPLIRPWPKAEERKDRKHNCVVAILLRLLQTDGEPVPFPGQGAKRVSPLLERLISELLELFTHKSSPPISRPIKGCGGKAVLLFPWGEATKQLSPISTTGGGPSRSVGSFLCVTTC